MNSSRGIMSGTMDHFKMVFEKKSNRKMCKIVGYFVLWPLFNELRSGFALFWVTDFWKEAHILGQLHHPNIVALYGIVTDGPVNNLATVTEYMVNGSLKQVPRRKDRTIDRRKRLIIAMDAAFGMEYLHDKNIVHFDLKSHNFLVNMRDPLRPIGDLGLSKIKQRTLVSGGVRGTIL